MRLPAKNSDLEQAIFSLLIAGPSADQYELLGKRRLKNSEYRGKASYSEVHGKISG